MRVNRLFNKKLNYNHKVNKLCNDSRKVELNDVYFAIIGTSYNGEDYIKDAIKKGAKTIVLETLIDEEFLGVNIVVVKSVRKSMAEAYKLLHRKYLKKMKFIGVTGTNGKTTTTTLIFKYLNFINKKTCLIGSNGIFYNNEYYETINTTPDIGIIYDSIKKAYFKKCKYVVMEVSSHAIKQHRVTGIDFDVALFTNLTLDHLDYHIDFTDYKYTKGLFLKDNKKTVILNKDSEHYDFYKEMVNCKLVTYGKNLSDYLITNINLTEEKSEFKLRYFDKFINISSNLIGLFNVYNLTSFIAILDQLKLITNKLSIFLNSKLVIPGRMEELNYKNRKIIIDYAHTPDGVFNVLSFLKELKRKIILVVGCGGSRDKTKRTVIGQISSDNSDYVIFTSDNPRDEDENEIINQIICDIEKDNFEVIVDRRLAIQKAIDISEENDIIAILGRGNEKFQKVKGKLIELNDMEIVKEYVEGK